jgi:PKHD-type hydroxylase
MDNDVTGKTQAPVRKISMTLLLSDPSTFEGGELEFMDEGRMLKLQQGQAVFFASWLQHRVKPVTKGERYSLVMWFGGPPFK